MNEQITPDAAPAPESNPAVTGGNETIGVTQMPTGQTFPMGDMTHPQSEETQEAVPQEQETAKDDPNRYEYWQSQTDKVKSELNKAREEIDYYKNTLGPIESAIRQNPSVLDNLESLSEGQPNGQPQRGNQRASSQRPVRPSAPVGYNEVDAYNDPNSDSFKHRLEVERYRDNMMDYYEHADQARQQNAQIALQQQQQQMVINNARQTALNGWGYNESDANEFIQFASNPTNISMDHLKALYEMQKYGNRQQQEAENKVVSMQNQAERLKVPRPTAVTTGTTPPPVSEEQAFSNALLANVRK